MSEKEISNQMLSIFGVRREITDCHKNREVLFKEIQKLESEIKQLKAKNRRLIQIINEVTEEIKKVVKEDDLE